MAEGIPKIFPHPIYEKDKRTDIIMRCERKNVVYLVELMVPREDKMDVARVRKIGRHVNLLEERHRRMNTTMNNIQTIVLKSCRRWV